MTFRPMPILTVFSVASLVILVLLGNWQYARYSEKIANPSTEEQVQSGESVRVIIDRAHPGNAQQVYGFADSEPIWRRYVPGKVDGSGEAVLVMVEATGGAQALPVAIRDLPEAVTFDGIIAAKVATDSRFASRDVPEADTWYSLRPEEMAERLGLNASVRVAEPIIMIVRNREEPSRTRQTLNPYAFAKPVDPLPPERHFGYALTWWGMALGLLGVYVALHRSRGRLKF